tara:strand:- start:19769 stop:22189 length:2421 start_codon:yes stop_codon:yes gene_type:complete
MIFVFGRAAAQTASITGVVLDEEGLPLADVHIRSATSGTTSDLNGFYLLEIVSEKETTIVFTHLGHQNTILENLVLTTNEIYPFNPVLKTNTTQMAEVVVMGNGSKVAIGITTVPPETIRNIPGANAGVENVLNLLPGVTINNELSTQYSVRGGNYDENLVYVNGIPVYRPFLIRSGQQEGLSFVNSDMVRRLEFSAGGFQAKYGDKLSSVLDITYKRPTRSSLALHASLMGAETTIETVSKNKKFSSITGFRYRDNGLLVNSQQTRTNFNPTFVDLQSYFSYAMSKKVQLEFLGTLGINAYNNEPLTRETNFGTLDRMRTLTVFYEGREKNRFSTAQGALKANFFPNESMELTFSSALFHTIEEEYSDVIAQYTLAPSDSDLEGQIASPEGYGSHFKRARNDLDALIANLAHTGSLTKQNSKLEWGVRYSHEDIRDQIRESEFLDSTGFSVRPPNSGFENLQPGTPNQDPLEPYSGIYARNQIKTNRFSGYLQFGQKLDRNYYLYYNLGIRMQHWSLIGDGITGAAHTIVSPRAQLAIKPKWKRDMLFQISGGVYQQPPMYRELRDEKGIVHPEVQAQRSYHIVLSHEYSFKLWDRPFTLIGETYYKKLDRVNTYTLEDVRVRYAANNHAKAFAQGAELRLNGAFVPGTQSWISVGYLKTEENINNRGYIARPTDQRLKLGLLFQDYVPDIPHLRMYLNLVYHTGVPGGSPNYADPYIFRNRLRDYKRADLGISHIFVDADTRFPRKHWLGTFKELNVGLEIFNLFNTQNSITNTWVRDAVDKQEYAVPNFMTSRVLNLTLGMRF